MFDSAPSSHQRDIAENETELRGAHTAAPRLQQPRLQRDLASAVAGEAFVLHYQPRLELESARQVGAEALIRWPDRRGGLIVPSVFLPMAERLGLMADIGGWVLRAACAEATHWPGGCAVSVNISAHQLAGGMLLTQLAMALEQSGLDPELLEIELTEAMLIDLDVDTLLTLSAVRDLGVGVSLDDFGTGFASFAILKRLPLTSMKLDHSLIRSLPGDRQDAAVTRALIATGHALDLIVVAEGIETEGQHLLLRNSGCDEGQGFLLSHPLPASAIRARLAGEATFGGCDR